jgi:hypothetical protein
MPAAPRQTAVVPIDGDEVDSIIPLPNFSGPTLNHVHQPKRTVPMERPEKIEERTKAPKREFSVKSLIRETSSRFFGSGAGTNKKERKLEHIDDVNTIASRTASKHWVSIAGRKKSVVLFGRASVIGADIEGRRESVMTLQNNLKTTLAQTENPSTTVIDPNSAFMRRWDLFMVILLCFTALVTPFEIAFLRASDAKTDAWWRFLFAVNRLVDIGFLVDMLVQCFVKYFDPHTGVWVTNLSCIRFKYFKSWFAIDLVSILPFDSLALGLGEDSNFSKLRGIRVMRLLRLIKLLRVLRSARIFKRLVALVDWSHSSLMLFKFVTIILVQAHWFACLWRMSPLFCELGGMRTNWISASDKFSSASRWDEDKQEFIFESGVGSLYFASFEFALAAMVISYGEFAPANTLERIIALLAFIIAGSTYAYVIGAICGVIATMDMASQQVSGSSAASVLSEWV